MSKVHKSIKGISCYSSFSGVNDVYGLDDTSIPLSYEGFVSLVRNGFYEHHYLVDGCDCFDRYSFYYA